MATYTQLLDTRKTARAMAQATRDAAYSSNLNALATLESTNITAQRAADDTFDASLAANVATCVSSQRSTLVPLFAACITSAHGASDATAFATAAVTQDDTARAQTSVGMGLRALAAAAEAVIAADSQAAPGIVGALMDGGDGALKLRAANANAMAAFKSGAPVLSVDACRLLESELRRAGANNRGTLSGPVSTRWTAWLNGVNS